MEDALVLARTSSSVVVIHRRDKFRASRVLAQRVLSNSKITVKWNSQVRRTTLPQIQSTRMMSSDNMSGKRSSCALLTKTCVVPLAGQGVHRWHGEDARWLVCRGPCGNYGYSDEGRVEHRL